MAIMDDITNGNAVSLKDYMDSRFAAQDKATALALETVRVASDTTSVRDSARQTNMLSLLSILVSVALSVYMIAKHV